MNEFSFSALFIATCATYCCSLGNRTTKYLNEEYALSGLASVIVSVELSQLPDRTSRATYCLVGGLNRWLQSDNRQVSIPASQGVLNTKEEDGNSRVSQSHLVASRAEVRDEAVLQIRSVYQSSINDS